MSKHPPQDDPTSIGSILLNYGVSPTELSKALVFQKDNEDLLLGEVCVMLNIIDRKTLEIAIAKQKAERGSSARDMVSLATKKTKDLSASIGGMTALSLSLLERLK